MQIKNIPAFTLTEGKKMFKYLILEYLKKKEKIIVKFNYDDIINIRKITKILKIYIITDKTKKVEITEIFIKKLKKINLIRANFKNSNIYYLTNLSLHHVKTIYETDYGIINNTNKLINMIDYRDYPAIDLTSTNKNIIILSYCLIHPLSRSISCKSLHSFFKFLEQKNNITIAFVQDEYYGINDINNMFKTININHIFTVLTKDKDIQTIYAPLYNNVQFTKHLTGYVSTNYKKYYKKIKDKKNDIFYRGRKLIPIYGELGRMKFEIGYRFEKFIKTKNVRLEYDISSSDNERIYGERWYHYLSNSKTTLATPSGSNVLNLSKISKRPFTSNEREQIGGSLFLNSTNDKFILTMYDKYKFEEQLNVNAISPKMFEAIAMGTVLIMIEDDEQGYSGILKPNIHYIPVKRDYSNLGEVIEKIKDNNFLQNIADKAYKDIIESDKYTIKSLCNDLDSVISQYI